MGGARVAVTLWTATIAVERRLRVGELAPDKIGNVLVIGGAGYIGSVLVRKLLDQGYDVTVLDALVYGDESIRDLYDHPNFELIRGDLRDIEAVVRALQYADAVVHLGALVGDPACALDCFPSLSLRLDLYILLKGLLMLFRREGLYGVDGVVHDLE